MGKRHSSQLAHGFVIILLRIAFSQYCFVTGELISGTKAHKVADHPVKTIQSEDGDIIDCIDIYKQPAFDHPALRDHNIQMAPGSHKTAETMRMATKGGQNETNVISQLWHRNGRCPKGTIPVRRYQNKEPSTKYYGRKKPEIYNTEKVYFQQANHTKAILMTVGYSYIGVKGDIKVWNPNVAANDEYSISQVSLKNGRYDDYESVQSGWAVNPSLYGDKKTRLFVYWTADASKTTGCFDLTCSGFVQTSTEIALGAAIYPLSVPDGLPFQIILYIFKDLDTGNWWVQYGEKINIGYWPPNLFVRLSHHGDSAEWGGEVYSSRLGKSPHTETGMGNGKFPDYISGDSGSIKRMRIRDNSLLLKIPDYAYTLLDEYDCYGADYIQDYVEDPEFYYGGPGRNYLCP